MKRATTIVFIVLASLCVWSCGGKETSQQENESKETVKETVLETETINESETMKETETVKETKAETTEEAEKESQTQLQTETEKVNPFNKVSSLEIKSAITDFEHLDFDTIRLGNDENLTINILASPAGLTADDVYIDYDDTILSCELNDISSDDGNNTTNYVYKIYAIAPGYSEVFIVPAYDIAEYGLQEAEGYSIDIRGLDSEEGRIVYITPNGKKYHYDYECAGENASAVPLYEAESFEYEPCGKCAL